MTSGAAGAEVRHAMGVTVFAGMLGVTAFGLLLTPVFYVLIRKLTDRSSVAAPAEAAAPAPLGIGHTPEVHGV